MRVRHPVDAHSFGDLGASFLVDYALASTLGQKGTAGRSNDLAELLTHAQDAGFVSGELSAAVGFAGDGWAIDVGDLRVLAEAGSVLEGAAGEDAMRQELPRVTAMIEGVLGRVLDATPLDVGRPLFASLPLAAGALIDALALARMWQSHGAAEILLPAPLEPREELPPRKQGDVLLIEIGDLRDAASAVLHDTMFSALEGRSVCWRWMHGPTTLHPEAVAVSRLAEAVAQHAPNSFWDAIEALFRSSVAAPGVWDDLVRGLPIDADRVIAAADAQAAHDGVRRDHRMLRVCAIPESRPAFVIGRRYFHGTNCVADVVAHLDTLG